MHFLGTSRPFKRIKNDFSPMTQTSSYFIYNSFETDQQKPNEKKSALIFSILLFCHIEINNLILPHNHIILGR